MVYRVTLEDVYRELRTVIGAISTMKDSIDTAMRRLDLVEERMNEMDKLVRSFDERLNELSKNTINLQGILKDVNNNMETIRRQSTLLNENIKSTLQSLATLRKDIREELKGIRYELKDKITQLLELESRIFAEINRVHGILSNNSMVMASMELDLKKREEVVRSEISTMRLVLSDLATGVEELKNLLKSRE